MPAKNLYVPDAHHPGCDDTRKILYNTVSLAC
jgi:hypothetical protein